MKMPVPLATIFDDDRWQRAVKRIAELGICKPSSVEEVEKIALVNAVEA